MITKAGFKFKFIFPTINEIIRLNGEEWDICVDYINASVNSSSSVPLALVYQGHLMASWFSPHGAPLSLPFKDTFNDKGDKFVISYVPGSLPRSRF